MIAVSKTGLNRSLNVTSESTQPSSRWIIGAESPLEDCFTDRFPAFDRPSTCIETYSKHNNFVESKTLLLHILRRRQAEVLYDFGDDEQTGGIPSESHKFWAYLFQKHIIRSSDKSPKDDMVFYVKYLSYLGFKSPMAEVEVYRINSPNLPPLINTQINWEESVYLNFILQKFDYYITCAICTRTGDKELQVLNKVTQRVYASPSCRNMNDKGTSEEMTYPDIFFSIDNFEEAFSSLVIRDGELLTMELIAKDLEGNFQAVLLSGTLRYEGFKRTYDSRMNLSHRMAQKVTFGWISKEEQRVEFLKIRGSMGKGHVEVAISRVKGSGPDTPLHTPSVENLCENFSQPNMGHRRMSDPNVSRNYNLHGGGLQRHKSRSDNENVDKMGLSNCTEVTATNLEDELDDSQENYYGFVGKSFGQAWHWFKEQMRVNSVALHCFLTYVSLPWHRIIADLLDPRDRPIISRNIP